MRCLLPLTARFGIVGVALFAWLIAYVIRLIGSLVRCGSSPQIALYSVGMLCVLFVLIESTTGTAMVNCGGVMAMLILGIVAGRAIDRLSSASVDQSV